MSFYEQFFSEPMAERQRIAEAAGLSLAYIHKHTYVQQREPRFHFHNAVGLDKASNGKLSFLDITEGTVDWSFVLERLKAMQKVGRIRRQRIRDLPTAQFEEFWRLYPRRIAKPQAMRHWRLGNCDAVFAEIIAHVQTQLLTEQWKAGSKFIPYPTTYLGGRHWEMPSDPPEPSPTSA